MGKKNDDVLEIVKNGGEEAAANGRQKAGGTSVLVTTGLAISLLFALIQFFDPILQAHHSNDIFHHHTNHNPVLRSLAEFSHGRDGLQHIGALNTTEGTDVRAGRERILHLLNEAGAAKDLTDGQIEKLPKGTDIVDLYGDQVIVVGQEDCAAFRKKVGADQIIMGVAGLFNTGTNLLDMQLRKNVEATKKSLWQVPWGKHRMAEVKWNHTAAGTLMEHADKKHVLPIVIIRDPFAWLQSMCSHPYATAWRHGKQHCPNLVPSKEDREIYKSVHDSFKVTVKFDKDSHYKFDSLVHLWSEWYKQYLDADYPVLMIRFEDLVFQPVSVLREIANCVQGTLKDPIQYQLKSSKAHGSGTDYIKAIIKTADAMARPKNMTNEDLAFASESLDARLMKLFNYAVPMHH